MGDKNELLSTLTEKGPTHLHCILMRVSPHTSRWVLWAVILGILAQRSVFIVGLSHGAYSPWGGWNYSPMLQMSKLRTLKSHLSHTANKQEES